MVFSAFLAVLGIALLYWAGYHVWFFHIPGLILSILLIMSFVIIMTALQEMLNTQDWFVDIFFCVIGLVGFIYHCFEFVCGPDDRGYNLQHPEGV